MANLSQQIKPSFSIENIEAHPHFHTVRWLVIAALLCLALGLSWQLYAFYRISFYPQTFINGVDVSNLTVSAAQEKLTTTLPAPPNFELVLTFNQASVASSSSQLQASYPYPAAVAEIFQKTHQTSFWQQLTQTFGTKQQNFTTAITLNAPAVEALVTDLAKKTDKPGTPATVTLKTSGSPAALTIQPGVSGEVIDRAATLAITTAALDAYSQASSTPKLTVTAVQQPTRAPLTETQQAALRELAGKLVGKTLTLMAQRQSFVWNDQTLITLLNPYLDTTKPETYFDATRFSAELEKISAALPNHPVDAQFEYDPETLVVKTFNPGKDGLVLDTNQSSAVIETVIRDWIAGTAGTKLHSLALKVDAQPPNLPLSKTNNLGIQEVVGFGESYYAHSIPTRVHNVALTAKKVNLTIVKPGAEFSFNKTLGEVSAATGFKPAYVIKSGKTELGDGGGVCQVSSTLFRALLNGGLDITLRRPHSYRVTYYELNSQPGFDATVYEGNVDLRFINDTPGHLLILTETDSTKLWMKVEIYGTKDGRVSEITDYKTWGATPAKPTEYIPDASLAPGKKKQIDWPAAGLKASFKYTVRDAAGNIKQQETYTSNYQAWSAKFLVGP